MRKEEGGEKEKVRGRRDKDEEGKVSLRREGMEKDVKERRKVDGK